MRFRTRRKVYLSRFHFILYCSIIVDDSKRWVIIHSDEGDDVLVEPESQLGVEGEIQVQVDILCPW